MDETEKKEEKSNKWGWFICAVLVLLSIYVIDWGFIKGEITEYPIAACPECPTGLMTLNKRVYKPSASRQEVISWMPDFEGVDKYTDCAVIDRENWECKFDDASGTFGFTDGQYWNDWNDDEDIKKTPWEYVPRHRYLYVYWRNSF